MICIMGVDIGPSTLKAAVYDANGVMIAFSSFPTKTSYYLDTGHPEWVYWEPEAIWNGVVYAIKSCISQLDTSGKTYKLASISVTGMGMDGLPVDKNGKWLYPFISWHCSRTEPQCRTLSKKIGKEHIFMTSGLQAMSIHSVYRMVWMKENHPEIYEKTYKWLLIEDYINYLLCESYVTDYSMASTTSLLDYQQRKWSDELISLTGVDGAMLPEIRNSGTIIGEISANAARETGLPKGLPVVLGGHDYICAALAVGAYKPGNIMDMIGSWEMLLSVKDEATPTKKLFDAGLKIDCHVIPDKYCIVGDYVSLFMLEWFQKTYGLEESLLAKQMDITVMEMLLSNAEKSNAGSHGVFFLPHLCGAGSPKPDNCSLGAFIGLNESVTKADMIRSIVECINYQCFDVINAIENTSGTTSTQITAVGDAARHPFWMQNKADITGCVVEVPNIKDVTTCGAALLAGIGAGIYRDENDAFQRTFAKGITYEPNIKNHNEYLQYFEIYKMIQPALRGINKRIFSKFKS